MHRGTMAIKGYPAFPQSTSITGVSLDCLVSYLGHSFWGGLLLCRDLVSVFYSSSQLSHRTLIGGVLSISRDALGELCSTSWLRQIKRIDILFNLNFNIFVFEISVYRNYINEHDRENLSKTPETIWVPVLSIYVIIIMMSCHAHAFPDPSSPFVSIVHNFRRVFRLHPVSLQKCCR